MNECQFTKSCDAVRSAVIFNCQLWRGLLFLNSGSATMMACVRTQHGLRFTWPDRRKRRSFKMNRRNAGERGLVCLLASRTRERSYRTRRERLSVMWRAALSSELATVAACQYQLIRLSRPHSQLFGWAVTAVTCIAVDVILVSSSSFSYTIVFFIFIENFSCDFCYCCIKIVFRRVILKLLFLFLDIMNDN